MNSGGKLHLDRRECILCIPTVSFCTCLCVLPANAQPSGWGSPQPLCRGDRMHSLHARSPSETHTGDSVEQHCLPCWTSHSVSCKEGSVIKPLSLKYLTRVRTTNKPDFTSYKLGRHSPRQITDRESYLWGVITKVESMPIHTKGWVENV